MWRNVQKIEYHLDAFDIAVFSSDLYQRDASWNNELFILTTILDRIDDYQGHKWNENGLTFN